MTLSVCWPTSLLLLLSYSGLPVGASPMDPVFVHSPGTGLPADVGVQDAYAYRAARGGLVVFDVSDPAAPAEVGSCDTPGDALGVDVSGEYAYVAAFAAGLRVVDVSNPTMPTEVGGCEGPADAFRVVAAGDHAYLVDTGFGLPPRPSYRLSSLALPPGSGAVSAAFPASPLARESRAPRAFVRCTDGYGVTARSRRRPGGGPRAVTE